jgi:hypothetical protein
MSEGPARPQQGARPEIFYQVAGDARQQVNLVGLRDRIRGGALQPTDEVAVVGTDLWKPASQYAELARYFALVQRAPQAASAAVQQPAAPMGSRILAGAVYPFSSVSSAVVIAVASLSSLVMPLLSIPFALLGSVYAMGVIRKSSEGQTTPPTLAEVGGPLQWIVGILQIIAVTLISAWPVILVSILVFMGLVRSMIFVFVGIALIVTMLYYPASLATVAVWKSIKSALSVQQIFRFIGILGGSYYAVIGMWIVMVVIFELVITALGHVLAGQVRLLTAINVAGSIYVLFYASHLLGWAVHLHRDQL